MTMIDQKPGALDGNQRAIRIARAAAASVFGAIIAVNLGSFIFTASPFSQTHLAAVLLAGYLMVEVRLYLRRSDVFGLLSPAFLALIFHFLLAYLVGITAAAFQPRVMDRFAYWLPDLDAGLAETMLLAMLAAFCMLRGYALGRPLARRLRRAVRRTSLIRREIRPDMHLALWIQVAYLALVAHAIQLGVYGLHSTPESLSRHADMIQFLNLFLAAGKLSYFLILLHYFNRQKEGRASALHGMVIAVLIAVHVSTGALTGFKSQIVFPFVIAGCAYYLATQRMPLRFVGFAVVALVVAYVVVEPYRVYLGLLGQPPASAAEAAETLTTALEMREQLSHGSNMSLEETIASRFDLLGMTTLAVDYVDHGKLQPDIRQRFQDSILLAPVLAYVPRAIWSNKPSYAEGVWFNQNVRERWHDEQTSVGLGPIGYLYMAGGVGAVVLGFLGLGLMQSLIFEGIGRGGGGGMIIFLSVAVVLATIPSSFGPSVAGILRTLPLAFVTQLILLRRSHPLGQNGGSMRPVAHHPAARTLSDDPTH